MISKEFSNLKPLVSHFMVRDKIDTTKPSPDLRERTGPRPKIVGGEGLGIAKTAYSAESIARITCAYPRANRPMFSTLVRSLVP